MIAEINKTLDIKPLVTETEDAIKDFVAEVQDRYTDVPIWHKKLVTVEEAAKLYNIGMNRFRSMADDSTCDFVLHVGNKRLINIHKFDEYINSGYCYSV